MLYLDCFRVTTGLPHGCRWSIFCPRMRPTALQDRNRDSDDDDYQDRDYDLAALANNLSQAFRYGIYSNDDIEEAHGSMERDGEDIYFDDESAEVVISSLRLGGDDQESGSLFTNPKWFAFEEERNAHEHSTASSSPNTEGHDGIGGSDNVIVEEDEDLADTAASGPSEQKSDDVDNMPRKLSEGLRQNEMCASYKPPEWVEWRESSDALEDPPPLDTANVSDASQLPSLPNGKLPVELDQPDKTAASRVTTDEPADSCKTESEGSRTYPSLSTEVPEGNQSTENILDPHSGIDVFSGILEHEKVN